MAEFKLRPEVAMFAALMEARLREKDPLVADPDNEEWIHWRECDWQFLLDQLQWKVGLIDHHAEGDESEKADLLKSCVDAANFAMMMADHRGVLMRKEEKASG